MISITLPNLRLSLYDFRDQATLGIVDASSYAVLPTSTQLSMQITAPGYQTVNVAFTPGGINIYKCSDLGITCGPTDCCPLPDGIYDVVYTVLMPSSPIPAVIEILNVTVELIDKENINTN